ncbi:hypothetical protein ACFL2T_02015 [Elusimicrobiota bacterium]
MADAELVAFIRDNIQQHGPQALREQLSKDGVELEEIEAAFAELSKPPARQGRKTAIVAVFGGALLLGVAAFLSIAPSREQGSAGGEVTAAGDLGGGEESDGVFRGHYGYILRLPEGYAARGGFLDPRKTHEVVYIYKKGTDSNHFIHEGLYGHLGIFRLEALPRRIPQGFVGIDTLKSWVTRKLDQDKAIYTLRSLIVHGMPAFIVTATKPFKYTRAHIVGEKVRYTFVGGESEDETFTTIISSLAEVSPHDRPGK